MPSTGNLKDTNIGIRCDRTTARGNPFKMRGERERDAVCEGFRRYLWLITHCWCAPGEAAEKVASEMNLLICPYWRSPTESEFAIALKEVEDSPDDAVFLCHCNPKRCHCDTYVSYRLWHKGFLSTKALTSTIP